jgi:hypothetical protein
MTAVVLAMLLAACARPSPAPIVLDAPSCPQPRSDREAALRQLPGAGYACVEALAPLFAIGADDTTIERLLAMARPPSHSLARRNALRVLGRALERMEPAALTQRAPALRAELLVLLASERDATVLQEVIWILDTFLFPAREALSPLAALVADPANRPPLRARAMNAVSRLILTRPGPVAPADMEFVLAALGSDEPGVRARAALILERWRDDQLDSTARARAVATLSGALVVARHEPLVTGLPQGVLAPSVHHPLNPPLFSGRPDLPVAPLAARAAIARALDRFVPAGRSNELQAAFEAVALPHTLQHGEIVLRGALPPEHLAELVYMLDHARGAFFALLGPEFAAPLPGEERSLTVLVFGDPAAYQAFMQAFVGFGDDVDGVYVERRGVIYTYARGSEHSANTLETTLAHEYAHYLAGQHVFPGQWHDAGYHAAPKGWADEGLAELVAAQAVGNNAPSGDLCEQQPRLEPLLEQRAGYDRFGSFAYHEAHALVRYLLHSSPERGRRLYAAFRAGAYRSADVAALAGAPSLVALEADWHADLGQWCRTGTGSLLLAHASLRHASS